MSIVTVSDIPLVPENPAQRLRRLAAAVRVHFTWWGVHRTLSARQKEEVGVTYEADARFLTAGKKLVDTRHEAFRRLTSLRTRISNYWRGLTLPYVEAGVRLIRQNDIESFVHSLTGFREELMQAEAELLNAVYEDIKADARRRLGRLYNPSDYPPEVQGLFGLDWDFPAVGAFSAEDASSGGRAAMAEPQLVVDVGCERSEVASESEWSCPRPRMKAKPQKIDKLEGRCHPASRPSSISFAGNEKVNQGEKHMKATIENGELVIRLPLNKTPVLSSSGKTLVVATSHGNQKTDAVVNGQPVLVGVNAYITRPTR